MHRERRRQRARESADASFVLTTSVVDDIEDANASTDARTVCDAMGNCATAGPFAGIRVDRRDPEITLSTPSVGAVYQLNKVVAAAYSARTGALAPPPAPEPRPTARRSIPPPPARRASWSTPQTRSGTPRARRRTTRCVANTISISNLPAQGFVGGNFVPAFAYAGNGATSVTSTTPQRCAVSGDTVTFIHKGTCRLVAHAAATANFDVATGPVQTFVIDKQTTTISITNIPAAAVNGSTFTPVFAYSGDGATHLQSATPAVCRVAAGVVRFVGGGTCTLVPRASATPAYYQTVGDPQSFVIAPAATTISIMNIPNKPKAGKSFAPRFDYDGDGQTSVTSSTPAVCGVIGATVDFQSAGTCTLTASAAATVNYTAATGAPESFVVK